MNSGNDKKNGWQKNFLKETLRLTLLGMGLLLLTTFVPLFSLMLFLMPVLISLLLTILPKGYALGALGCWLAFSALVLQSPSLFYMLVLFLFLSLSFSALKFKNWPAAWTIGIGALVMTGGMLAGLYLLTDAKGDLLAPLIQGYEQAMNQGQGIFKDLMDSTGLNLDSLMKQIKMILPGMLVNLSILCSLVNYYVTFHVLRRRRFVASGPSFSEFALPGNAFGGIVLIYVLLLLMKLAKFPLVEVIELNGIWIFILLFYIQGLAVLRFWAKRKMSFLLGGMLFLGALLFAPLSMAVLAMGFFDGALNFRRLPR